MASDERAFTMFRRGQVRDEIILAVMRNAFRKQVNPDTGAIFTEDEIALITQPGSRYYAEADGIDLLGLAAQARDGYLADQFDPRTAASPILRGVHAPLWVGAPLGATGGSGTVLATADVGTIFPGSSTLGDPSAQVARDPNGKRYQVVVTTTCLTGTVSIPLAGIDVGADTNPREDDVLTWEDPPAGSAPQAVVEADFTGGFDAENDPELAARIVDRIRRRQGSGNSAHLRAWTQDSSTAVSEAFVYPCAFFAGSGLVVPLQKRGSATGPLARIPSIGTLNTVRLFVVPPASPHVPERVYVLVLPPVSQPSDVVLKLSLKKGSAGGWFNTTPWPAYTTNPAKVKAAPAPTQTAFRMTADTALPGGAASLTGSNAPSLMVWDVPTSRFVSVSVTSITDVGGGDYDVVCTDPGTHIFAANDYISPLTDRRDVVAEAVEGFFDLLGPGEIVPSTDDRSTRAGRFPRPTAEAPFRLGQDVISFVRDVLGGALSAGELTAATFTTPTIPPDPSFGPALLTLGKLGLYQLD